MLRKVSPSAEAHIMAEVIRLQNSIATDEADEVYAPGPKGEFGVLPGHAHYVTPLSMGRLTYTRQGKKHAFFVSGGFMEVISEKVLIMANEVEKSENIDPKQAKAEADKLEQKLLHETIAAEEFEEMLQERQKQETRLELSSK